MYAATVLKPQCDDHSRFPRAEAQLAREADKARTFGKLFVVSIFESLARTLGNAPRVAALIERWPGDLASAGVIFRLNAGVHALARSGDHPALGDIYRDASFDTEPNPVLLDLTMSLALIEGETELLRWLRNPTQTNEVARVATLAGVILEMNAQKAMPCDLLELGASAGLNLNLAHYDINMGSARTGDPASLVRIAPEWIGPAPVGETMQIARAAGVDPFPRDVRLKSDDDQLHSYIWPGETARSQRLEGAIAIARQHVPNVETGRAGSWLAHRLAIPQQAGERRVVFHSMVTQYMPEPERNTIDRVLDRAGSAATSETPLARVGLEWNTDRTAVEISLTQWDGGPHSGQRLLMAHCHPYAEWVEWFGVENTLARA